MLVYLGKIRCPLIGGNLKPLNSTHIVLGMAGGVAEAHKREVIGDQLEGVAPARRRDEVALHVRHVAGEVGELQTRVTEHHGA